MQTYINLCYCMYTMVRKDKMLTFDESKLNKYVKYCTQTGRVLSRTVEIAMDEYVRENPIQNKEI